MSLESAIVRILQQWTELKTHFEIANTRERSYYTDQLYSMFRDGKNHAFLIFLKHVLGEVQMVNKKFEAAVSDPTKLLNDLVNLINSLCLKILVPGKKFDEKTVIEHHLDPKPYLGFEFEEKMKEYKLSEEDKMCIRGRCINFVVELIKQLRQRLPENLSVLKSMSRLSVGECLNQIKPEILELAKEFNDDAAVLTRIDFQWRKLHSVTWTETSDTSRLWAEISNYRDATGDNPFQDLSELALTVLSLPHSNADVERVFSQMNIVKSKLRNRMDISTLKAILCIRYSLKRLGMDSIDYELSQSVISKIGTTDIYEGTTRPEHSKKQEMNGYNSEEDDADSVLFHI